MQITASFYGHRVFGGLQFKGKAEESNLTEITEDDIFVAVKYSATSSDCIIVPHKYLHSHLPHPRRLYVDQGLK